MATAPVAAGLKRRIEAAEIRAGVIGLGYVGLPLAVEFARAGYQVVGLDIDARKVDAINDSRSYVPDVSDADVASLVACNRLRATTDFAAIARLDTVNICVPTPLRKTRDPDVSYMVSAVTEIARYLHPGMLVILESTTYPGTTDELARPILEATGLRAGRDFFLAFSPERVDPGIRRPRARPVRTRHRARGHGRLDAGGRDGEAAREYVPRRQHRTRERDRDDVRHARH